MLDFLTGKRNAPAARKTAASAPGREPLKRERHLSRREEAKVYEHGPSVIDFLPWAEYLPEDECLLLDDGLSVGAVFLITPAGTEGRTQDRLDEIRNVTEKALQSSLDERNTHQWVVQFFCQDESDLTVEMDRIRGYVSPAAQGSAFTQAWLSETERHLKQISRPEGLFNDSVVTGVDWRGQMRRVRMVVYRYVNPRTREPYPPAVQLRQVCDRLVASLGQAGVVCQRQNGEQIHAWLLRLFNPAPEWIDPDTLYRTAAWRDNRQETLPVNNDFSETLFFTSPRSDADNGVWWFDNMAHRAVSVERLTSAPTPGSLTGEKPRGEHINALMDMMPPGTLACLTLLVQPQNVLEEEFKQQGKKSLGDNLDSEMAREQVGEALEWLKQKHKLYRGALTFIIRAPDLSTLDRYQLSLSTILMNDGLQPVNPEYELTPLNTLLRALPMCFNPELDTNRWYTWLTFVQHFAGVAPVYGRSTGTGNPGLTFFNRGGELLNFDPIKDRIQSAHKLLFGPTGAGKSATLTVELCQQMAIHRPRLFLVESGNSFGPLADYYISLGLTVNKVSIKPGKGTCLPVFPDSHLIMTLPPEKLVVDENKLKDIGDTDDAKDTGDTDDADKRKDDERDVLGEMEIAAILMITGGEKDEKLSRADRGLLRRSLVMTAERVYEEKRQMLPSDLKATLETIATDMSQKPGGGPRWHAKMQARASEMALALELMTEGFEGELFNREGEAWPEADVTIVDLGYLSREGYESQMALAVISLANTVNHIAERDQNDERDIIFTIDEAHVVTANPLVSPYFAKISKMWRKLGTWLWLATQNLKDYPDTAEKMLNMAEWWICLTMPPDEIEQVARFRSLTDEQKAMLLSAKKGAKKNGIPCYTEGVVLARNWNALFRSVPPSLYLALGMTEKDEKAQRKELMKTHQCSELEAVFMVARILDEKRGVNV
ncbi:conjugative transfer ATPase [Salmonella enterica]|nr:conjugative transfer ATPase [Salmonella enterica]EEH5136421.1 conjugative transfer ATPase [Salmonella enterica]EJN5974474.1 conjugative transfer ATPase [Salmonella enterica]EKA1248266.1 conjugative transfer ATPase [Salmonella enterica]ELV3413604.1 conjugative transfer ATPase [Salmonella enterica]